MKPIPVSGGQPPIGSQPTFKSKGSCLEFVGQNMSHEHEPPGNKNILTFEKRLSSSSSVKQPSPPSISLDPQPHLHPPPPASKTSQMDAKVPMWPPTSRCSSAWNRGSPCLYFCLGDSLPKTWRAATLSIGGRVFSARGKRRFGRYFPHKVLSNSLQCTLLSEIRKDFMMLNYLIT